MVHISFQPFLSFFQWFPADYPRLTIPHSQPWGLKAFSVQFFLGQSSQAQIWFGYFGLHLSYRGETNFGAQKIWRKKLVSENLIKFFSIFKWFPLQIFPPKSCFKKNSAPFQHKKTSAKFYPFFKKCQQIFLPPNFSPPCFFFCPYLLIFFSACWTGEMICLVGNFISSAFFSLPVLYSLSFWLYVSLLCCKFLPLQWSLNYRWLNILQTSWCIPWGS